MTPVLVTATGGQKTTAVLASSVVEASLSLLVTLEVAQLADEQLQLLEVFLEGE
jgi:hypothetical protein